MFEVSQSKISVNNIRLRRPWESPITATYLHLVFCRGLLAQIIKLSLFPGHHVHFYLSWVPTSLAVFVYPGRLMAAFCLFISAVCLWLLLIALILFMSNTPILVNATTTVLDDWGQIISRQRVFRFHFRTRLQNEEEGIKRSACATGETATQ